MKLAAQPLDMVTTREHDVQGVMVGVLAFYCNCVCASGNHVHASGCCHPPSSASLRVPMPDSASKRSSQFSLCGEMHVANPMAQSLDIDLGALPGSPLARQFVLSGFL